MTAMKLSEAIRLGAMLAPQCCGPFKSVVTRTTQYFGDVSVTCHCALTGAAIAAGKWDGVCDDDDFPTHEWFKAIEEFNQPFGDLTPPCPACGDRGLMVANVAIHLNDDHRWTREAIADWVESQENTRTAASETERTVTEGVSR